MYFYALSRGRAAPMLELVTQAYNSCSWRMDQSCADALSPQGNPPAVSRLRRMFMISSPCRAHLADRPADRVVEVSGSLRPAADGARPPVPSAPVVVVGFCALQACQDVIHLRFTNRHDLGVKSPSTAITLGRGVMANRASQTSRLTSRTQALLSGHYHGGIWLPHVALSNDLVERTHPSPIPT